jgi:uncharacterized membrane protein
VNPDLIVVIQQTLLWGAALAALIAVGFFILRKTRPSPENKELTTSQMLSNFRELHTAGQLSDAEYRTIKTALSAQLNDELKETGETG